MRTFVFVFVSLVVVLGCAAPEVGVPDAAGFDTAIGRPHCASDADCSDGVYCNGAERCAPASTTADARGCLAAPAGPCMTGQTCDEAGARCQTECDQTGDADHDGRLAVRCGGDDCDDADPNRHPGLVEVCDAAMHDEDCDPTTFGVRDLDLDGAPDAVCCNTDLGGAMHCGTDCDDTRAGVSPTSPEVCNRIDDDCDTAIDEGVLQTFTIDADGDGHGDATTGAATMMACFAPTGYAASHDDCDDTRGFVSPSGVEVCDAAMPPLDEDCDGVPNDVPGGCDCTGTESRDCGLSGLCAGAVQTCLGGHFGPCSIAPQLETCNGIDDDCDAMIDDGVSISCYPDSDNDGFATLSSAPLARCPDPSRVGFGMCPVFTTDRAPVDAPSSDCDDTSASARPGAPEACNGVDDDCDAMVDEEARILCRIDMDDDSYAPMGATTSLQCRDLTRDVWGYCPAHYTARVPLDASTTDCDDGDPARRPGRQELCNALDDDCDTTIDEGARLACYADADNDTYARAGVSSTMLCASSDPNRASAGFCPTTYTLRAPDVAATQDCDDTNGARNPGALERCNGIDDDCDSVVEEGLTVVPCFTDMDDDTYAPMGSASTPLCSDLSRAAWGYCPAGGTARDPSMGADCSDGNATIHPGAVELCDLPNPAVDQNCNGLADEPTASCYTDLDNDGYAPLGASPVTLCRSPDPARAMAPWNGCPPSYTGRAPTDATVADCRDSDATYNLPVACFPDTDSDSYGVGVSAYFCPDGPSRGGCPAMRTNRIGDCCDTDARAHPGQTTYQTTARSGCAPVGSFDFDCDGSSDRQCTTDAGTCTYPGTGVSCQRTAFGCWYGAVPACGATGTTLGGCGQHDFMGCHPTYGSMVQSCL